MFRLPMFRLPMSFSRLIPAFRRLAIAGAAALTLGLGTAAVITTPAEAQGFSITIGSDHGRGYDRGYGFRPTHVERYGWGRPAYQPHWRDERGWGPPRHYGRRFDDGPRYGYGRPWRPHPRFGW